MRIGRLVKHKKYKWIGLVLDWRIGQTGFVVETADFDSRIRVMIAGKTVWFFHFHLRKL